MAKVSSRSIQLFLSCFGLLHLKWFHGSLKILAGTLTVIDSSTRHLSQFLHELISKQCAGSMESELVN